MNGVLTGFEITYQSVTERGTGVMIQNPTIRDPKQTTAKLESLKPETTYRIYIRAINDVGTGEPYVYILFIILCFYNCNLEISIAISPNV